MTSGRVRMCPSMICPLPWLKQALNVTVHGPNRISVKDSSWNWLNTTIHRGSDTGSRSNFSLSVFHNRKSDSLRVPKLAWGIRVPSSYWYVFLLKCYYSNMWTWPVKIPLDHSNVKTVELVNVLYIGHASTNGHCNVKTSLVWPFVYLNF